MTDVMLLDSHIYLYDSYIRDIAFYRDMQASALKWSKANWKTEEEKRKERNAYTRYARYARESAKKAQKQLKAIEEYFGAEIAQRVENGETTESIMASNTAAEAVEETTTEENRKEDEIMTNTTNTTNTNDATRVYNLPPYGAMLEGYTPRMLNVNTNGNRKLKNSDTTRFIIWNLPAVKTCPFRTAACEKSCYACKAERVYPQVLPSRERNFKDSLEAVFVENMIYTINNTIFDARGRMKKAYAGKDIIFRIHESGDFYNLEYAQKWIEIIKYYEGRVPQLQFIAYTKSIKYFIDAAGFETTPQAIERANNGYFIRKNGSVLQANSGVAIADYLPSNLHVISSIWDDTREESRNLTLAFNFKVYTALSAADFETRKTELTECTCENCATCAKCWNRSYNYIVVKIH